MNVARMNGCHNCILGNKIRWLALLRCSSSNLLRMHVTFSVFMSTACLFNVHSICFDIHLVRPLNSFSMQLFHLFYCAGCKCCWLKSRCAFEFSNKHWRFSFEVINNLTALQHFRHVIWVGSKCRGKNKIWLEEIICEEVPSAESFYRSSLNH